MTYGRSDAPPTEPLRNRVVRVVALFAMFVAALLAWEWLAGPPLAASTWTEASSKAEVDRAAPGLRPQTAPTTAYGKGSVFDDAEPGVAKLDGALLAAVRAAASTAAADDIPFVVDSGWRSAERQEQLRREAVAKYGSEAEAAKWVAPADRSAHVSGDAVDLGPKTAREWLAANGARFDLCQVYDNEPWHYELRPGAASVGCPARYADAAHDPRLRP